MRSAPPREYGTDPMAPHFRERWFRRLPGGWTLRRRLHWRQRFLRWALRARFRPEARGDGPFTAVLLSYRRPQNIDLLLRVLLRTRAVGRVLLSNNNPEVPIRDWITVASPRLVVIEQKEPTGPASRLFLARDAGGSHFLLLDDDLFVYPEILDRLCAALLLDPSVPRGLIGQEWDAEKAALRSGVGGFDGELDVLNRVYALTAAQLHRAIALLGETPASDPREIVWEDLLLSFSGEGRPRCVRAGNWLDCPTADERGVSVMSRPGFRDRRLAVFLRLRALRDGLRSAPR